MTGFNEKESIFDIDRGIFLSMPVPRLAALAAYIALFELKLNSEGITGSMMLLMLLISVGSLMGQSELGDLLQGFYCRSRTHHPFSIVYIHEHIYILK